MDIFIKVDTGTSAEDKYIINPLFILLADAAMRNIEAVAKLFGLKPHIKS